jgi:hypothetical protein
VKGRKRHGGRKRWQRALSWLDRSFSAGHRHLTTCTASCGAMAEHKRRMRQRAHPPGFIWIDKPNGTWRTVDRKDPRATKPPGWFRRRT